MPCGPSPASCTSWPACSRSWRSISRESSLSSMTRTRRDAFGLLAAPRALHRPRGGDRREADREAAALPGAGAEGLDGAGVELDQPLDQRQADPQAALRPVERRSP